MKNENALNILVRLPAKLGDTILALPFLYALRDQFPNSSIYVIVQKEFEVLTYFMPGIKGYFAFSKKEYRGIKRIWKFSRKIKTEQRFDLFFCLPYSFSAALIGFFAGIKKRIGLNIEHRRLLFTHCYNIPPGINFGDEFILLLEKFTGSKIGHHSVYFNFKEKKPVTLPSEKYIVLNPNSGDQSRTMSITKTASLAQAIHEHFDVDVLLAGSAKEKEKLQQAIALTGNNPAVKNIAGEYSLDQLGWILHQAQCVLSTDSGLAHFANHAGAPTVVIFGAAEESHTSPYNPENLTILKKTGLTCIPCNTGTCKFGDPLCITELSDQYIIAEMELLMEKWSLNY